MKRRALGFALALWLPVWWLDLRAAYPLGTIAQSPVLRAGSVFALGIAMALAAAVAWAGLRAARGAEGGPRGRLLARVVAVLASWALLAGSRAILVPLAERLPGYGGALLLWTALACVAAGSVGWLLTRGLPDRVQGPALAALGVAGIAAFAFEVDARVGAEALVRRPLLAAHAFGMGLWLLGGWLAPERRVLSRAGAWLALAAPAVLAAVVGNPAAPRPRATSGPERPDVVIVMIDTLRAEPVGMDLAGRPVMPALRRLALGDATSFTQAYANAPATRPSVRALFTAELPTRWGSAGPPPPEAWNLATALRESGYRTAAFSASGVIDAPGFRAGFDSFWAASGRPLVQRSLLIRGLLCGRRRWCEFTVAADLRLHKEDGQVIRERFRNWLADAPRPLFAYLHLYDPHWPYYDRGYGLREARVEGRGVPDLPARRFFDLLRLEKGDPANGRLRETAAHREVLGRYLEEVRHSDEVLRDILDDLRRAGRYDSSLVVVVGDHGEEFFEHDGFGHGYDVYDEQLRVPLVVKWPRAARFVPMPRTVDTPVSLVDVFPTLTDLLALRPPPSPWQGRSLGPLLEGKRGGRPSPVVASIRYQGDVRIAYREGRYKVRLVHPESDSPLSARAEVFDLAVDPGEERPLPPDAHSPLITRARTLAYRDRE